MTELHEILKMSDAGSVPILFLYSDGGLEHQVTFILIQISLICLLFNMDLDYLCAVRTALYHSGHNPVEPIMSVVNLGLQSVGFAWQEMSEDVEPEFKNCNSLGDLQTNAERKCEIVSATADSQRPVKIQLT